MTRKCALCKESNYKNVYSFFSAPKDPIMRKCWEDALSMDVTDDTFICSKHFHQEDIVTHWVSGQPPHVITIKYKKCRLRPSAVPIIGIEFQNNIQNASTDDDTFELRVNRNESSVPQVTEQVDEKANIRYELSYSQGKKKCRIKERKRTDENFILIPGDDSYEASVSDVKQERVAMQEQTFLIPREDSLLQDETEDYDSAVRDYILRTEQKKWHNLQNKNQQAEVDAEKMKTNDELNQEHDRDDKVVVEDHIYLTSGLLNSSQDGECVDVWETNVLENIQSDNNEQVIESIAMEDCPPESMLFEDFLEVCTEANLPKGWIANVIPKGHETTIVYSFTITTNSSIPFVEKQVFLKSDMLLHFGTSNVEINPFEHNLIRDGKDTRVQTLTDIEDVIEEFDQRRICEAMNDAMLESNKNLSSVAIREGSKWRHLDCPVLLGEGELVCVRCRSLSQIKIDANKQQNKSNQLDVENVNPEMMVENVSEFELSPSASTNNLMAAIDSLNIPEIRKIMMKECLKTSTELDGQKSVKFSKTWIFLCVLLYIESPRMYRYMLLNNYLCLPPLFTIKRYLHRIKTEPRFYNYFQRSIEPFQPIEKKDTDAKSEET